MDYGQVIRWAFEITRRYRFLWVLALFAGTPVGSCGGNFGGGTVRTSNTGAGSFDDADRTFEQVRMDLTDWLSDHAALVIGIIATLIVIGLVFAVISLICSGALSRATADIVRGRESSLGAAWGVGIALFWRNVRLALLQALIVIPLALVGLIGGIAAVRGDGDLGAALAVVIPLGVALFVLAIPYGIVLVYARMSVAVSDSNALPAMLAGWRLLRTNLATSLMAWLVNVAVSIGVGIAVVIGLVVLAIPVAILLVIAYAVSPVTLAVVAITLGLAAALALIAFIAAFNTFNAAYWSQVYLRLAGRAGMLPPA